MYLARERFLVFEKTLIAQNFHYSRRMPKRRKKSKYKHAVIGKKKYYFYKIVWCDPTGDSGHAEAKDVKELKPAIMISQAYVFAKDNKCIWTFSSYDQNEEVFSFFFVFSLGVILKMEKVQL